MINKLTVKNFKKYKEQVFDLSGNVVLAGANDSGKTTLLQAIATWSLLFNRWREKTGNDLAQDEENNYRQIPVARQQWNSVSVPSLNLLWTDLRADKRTPMYIEMRTDQWSIGIEVIYESEEGVYVRPTMDTEPNEIDKYNQNHLSPIYIPSVSGIDSEEVEFSNPESIDDKLYKGKSGAVLRNLLLRVSRDPKKWEQLRNIIGDFFGYEFDMPSSFAKISTRYRHKSDENFYDLSSASSGLLQIILVFSAILYKGGTTFLIDEPDAHLHAILQERIYSKLREVAKASNSQLIIATHSEVIINTVESRELYALMGNPERLGLDGEKSELIRSLRISHMDIMLGSQEKKILYTEGYTDLNMLRELAKILNHRIKNFLEKPFWKESVSCEQHLSKGTKAQDHFTTLLSVQNDIKGVQIIDRDGNVNLPDYRFVVKDKLLKLFWIRYDIENYLVHPAVLARFIDISTIAGVNKKLANIGVMKKEMKKHLPDSIVDEPLQDHEDLISKKMRDSVLPNILDSAGISPSEFPYTRYSEIAAVMDPDEIHPDIKKKMDAIADHFGL